MKIDSIKVGHVVVDVYKNNEHINFRPYCIRYDGQGQTNIFDYPNTCLLIKLLEEMTKKHLTKE